MVFLQLSFFPHYDRDQTLPHLEEGGPSHFLQPWVGSRLYDTFPWMEDSDSLTFYWTQVWLLPCLVSQWISQSLTHSVSDVHETWLMWPWRVKMRELLVNIIFRSSLFSWCRIKTKVMLLMMKQNKSHAVDARTKGMLLIKLLHYYWNKVLSAALKIRYLQYNLYNIVVKDAFLKPAFVNAPLT